MTQKQGLDLSANHALLEELSTEHFYYCPNPGNAGDSAIACATYLAFEEYGCKYSIIPFAVDSGVTVGKTVVYGGGGNLVRYYQDARNFLKAHHRTAKKLVLLPNSIDGHEDLLEQFDNNVFLYCRDPVSYRFALRASPRANVRLAHDMVFMLDTAKVLGIGRREFGSDFRPSILRWKNTKRGLRTKKYQLLSRFNRNDLFAFRLDVEKTSLVLPYPNIDVSQVFSADDIGVRSSMEATYRMMEFLMQYISVHTNRLHVGILSTLLGKRVLFYDNAYGKNKYIQMHSLCHFDNVEWRGSDTFCR